MTPDDLYTHEITDSDFADQEEELGLVTDGAGFIPFEQWDILAYDVASQTTSLDQLIEGYETTESTLRNTLAHPHFSKMLEAKQDEILRLSGNAHFVNQSKLLAGMGIAKLMKRVKSKDIDEKELLRITQNAVKWGRLEPEVVRGSEGINVNAGAGSSVQFVIGGIPGLEFLQPSKALKANSKAEEAVVENVKEDSIEEAPVITAPQPRAPVVNTINPPDPTQAAPTTYNPADLDL